MRSFSFPSFSHSSPTYSLPKQKTRTSKEWEALIGGKILNRIGALALIIGVGFFLKYAFDNDWISETMRVLMGAAAGGALLFFAERTHKKDFKIFAQGLVGAGVAILYLSVYAAFNFYHLVPQVVAFGLMSGVTMITLWLALKYDSLAVTLLGWAGGFLTPIMLSTDVANEIGLFTYVALLDAGLLAIVLSKEKWIVLEPLSLAATAMMYFLWFVSDYTPDKFMPTLFFLVLFWMLFFGVEAFRSLRSSSSTLMVRNATAVAAAILIFTGLYNLFEPSRHAWMGFATLLLAVPHYFMFVKLKSSAEANSLSLQRFVLTAIILLLTATAIQFERFETVIAWSLEIALIVWAGTKWKMKSVWGFGVVMFVAALFKLLFSFGGLVYIPLEEFKLLLTLRAPAHILLAASMYFCAELLQKEESGSTAILDYAWCFVAFVFVSVETNDLFERWRLYADGDMRDLLSYKRFLTLSIVWLAYALALNFFCNERQRHAWRHAGLAIAALAVLVGVFAGISFNPIELFTFLLNYRVLTLVLLIAGMVTLTRLHRRYAPEAKFKKQFAGGLSIAVVVLGFVLVTGETRDFFQQKIHALESPTEWTEGTNLELDRLENMKQLSLSGVWLLSSILIMLAGLWRRVRNLRLVAIALFGFTILKIFIYDLSFLQTLYRIFSFMGLGVILLGVSYLYQKYKGIIVEEEEVGLKP